MSMTFTNKLPQMIYGTAWKKEATTQLVKLAINAGFKAIDTANQPKHYYEDLVGAALVQLYSEGIERTQLFLQTKFTPEAGHDHRLPYNPKTDYETQVMTSFESSLNHLKTDYIDSYLLHGPYTWGGLGNADWAVWKAMENLYNAKKTHFIGISNFNVEQLKLLTSKANIKPMIVQNRCYARRGWDKDVREFCLHNGIIYQGFSLLTANEEWLQDPQIMEIARRHQKTAEQIIFRFCLQIGITPLTGTSDPLHMQQDLQALEFALSPQELYKIMAIIP